MAKAIGYLVAVVCLALVGLGMVPEVNPTQAAIKQDATLSRWAAHLVTIKPSQVSADMSVTLDARGFQPGERVRCYINVTLLKPLLRASRGGTLSRVRVTISSGMGMGLRVMTCRGDKSAYQAWGTLVIKGRIVSSPATPVMTGTPTPIPSPTVPYVALGDSLTAGAGAADRATDAYPTLLARHVLTTSVLNLAVIGAGTNDLISRQLDPALRAHPLIVTVWIGWNDMLQGVPPTVYRVWLAQVIGALRAERAAVYVATLPDPAAVPYTATSGDEAFVQADNAAVVAEAHRLGAHVVDIYRATQRIWGQRVNVAPDGEHLTSAGYAVVADIFAQAMHHTRPVAPTPTS